MAEKSIDLGLTALDELFMTDEGRKESKHPRLYDIPLDQIDDMPNHPFKVREDDEDMIRWKHRGLVLFGLRSCQYMR